MESPLGELLTRWTIRAAVACYLLRLGMDAAGQKTRRVKRAVLLLWTLAGGLFLVHVACAFHFYHGWSHRAAYAHVAEQTAETVGVHWGGGLYFNYLFIGLWVGDVVAAWRRGDACSERRGVYWTVQTLFAFMFVNATIVFGPAYWRWVAIAVLPLLLLLRIANRRARTRSDS